MTDLRPVTSMRTRTATVIALLAAALLISPTLAAPMPGDSPTPPTSAVSVAAPTDADIALSLKVSGLSKPVFITSADDSTGRMFIVEQTGKIRILKDGKVLGTSFLSLVGKVSRGGEQGLLGLAFHPNFPSNRKLYVYYTNKHGNLVIREYRASIGNPNVVDTGTKRTVLKISHPGESNHNGGMLAFGTDGYLYIGTGDGGGSGDSNNHGQSKKTLLGKMLRIDVDRRKGSKAYGIPSGNPYVGKPGMNEIWQIGLRNPWRWSFDRANGNLWIGDVGQGEWEEVDRATRTGSGPGKGVNWGWRVLEGSHCFRPPSGCSSAGKAPPVSEYDHSGARCAVSGGYVYRGSAIPTLVGGYLFADYCSGELWVVNSTAAPGTAPTLLLDTNLSISGFGENAHGELYVTDLGGRVYLIVQG